MNTKIWNLHLAGRTKADIAALCGTSDKYVAYVIKDKRGKYPRSIEVQAMQALALKMALDGRAPITIRRQIWKVYRMPLSTADIRDLVAKDSAKSAEPSHEAVRAVFKSTVSRRPRQPKRRITAALCASERELAEEVKKEAKKLTERAPAATKTITWSTTPKGITQSVVVGNIQKLVENLLDILK